MTSGARWCGRNRAHHSVFFFKDSSLSEQMTATHLATGSAWDWFIVKEPFFFFTHDSIWYGAGYMLPNMPVQMFSQLVVLSPVSALASDEACWQSNGGQNLGRLHQMAALLRHLGQDVVDGKLAAANAVFFLPSSFFSQFFTKELPSLFFCTQNRTQKPLCFFSSSILQLHFHKIINR